jgi:MbtH protein
MSETYLVVSNAEEQFSIWPADQQIPAGWHEASFSGTREACLDHINEIWVDMRPLSLRRAMNDA